jgi:hypothetical protein
MKTLKFCGIILQTTQRISVHKIPMHIINFYDYIETPTTSMTVARHKESVSARSRYTVDQMASLFWYEMLTHSTLAPHESRAGRSDQQPGTSEKKRSTV